MEEDSLDGFAITLQGYWVGYVCLKLNVLTQNGQFPEGSRLKAPVKSGGEHCILVFFNPNCHIFWFLAFRFGEACIGALQWTILNAGNAIHEQVRDWLVSSQK